MTKCIPITQGQFAIVDDEDFQSLSTHKWYFTGKYARRHINKTISILMHREIMNHPQGSEVDHIDGDRLNNTRSNLRVCSHAQNGYNRKISRNNACGFKGVVKRKNRWVAQIYVNDKWTYLGTYHDPKSAALAYNQGASKYFGEFARLNKV